MVQKKQNKRNTVADQGNQRESDFRQTSTLVDNRPEAKAQNNLITMINNSPRMLTQMQKIKTHFGEKAHTKETKQKAAEGLDVDVTTDVIQGEFIAVIGPEASEYPNALQDGAETLKEIFNEDEYYNEDDIDDGNFRSPLQDETIYLIAHGDNPGVSLTKEAALGGKGGATVKNIVKKILQKFTKESPGEQFKGKIILEGCHTAEPVVDDEGSAVKGSMLYDFQEAMFNDNYFKKNLAPEVMIGGYLGQAFSSGDYSTGYGTANTEHPLTKKFQKSRSVYGEKGNDSSISYTNEESFLESRWRQNLDFGMPTSSIKSKRKKKK